MANLFSSNLSALRKAKQLNQSEAAIGLGLKRTTYANYESQHTQPDIELLVLIASFFGVSLDELLTADLSTAHPIPKNEERQNQGDAHVNTHPTAYLKSDLPAIGMAEDAENQYDRTRFNVYDLESRAAAGQALLLTNNDKAKPAPNMYLPGMGFGLHIRMPIAGDSMGEHFGDGEKVVGTWVPNFKEMREGVPHLLIDAEEGVVFKRLYFAGSKIIELVSDNPLYKPYRRGFGDILAIFRFRERHSQDFAPADLDLRRDMRELRAEMEEIKRLMVK